MKPINEIYADFLLGNLRFHWGVESNLYCDSLMFHMDKKYSTSATLCAVLYERIFTTRLIRETANPPDLVPAKENVHEQLENLLNREDEIVNVEKLSFRSITSQLVETAVLTPQQKEDCDKFYSEVRNPVAHGLTARLFKSLLDVEPANVFEIDANYLSVYKKASELLINKIYDLMVTKILLKQ